MRPLVAIVGLTAICLVGLPGCTTDGDSAPETTHLRIVVLPFLSFAPFFIAQEEGYFADERLQVEFVRLDRTANAIPALARGELDVVSGATNVAVLAAMARGAEIRFVADKGYIEPGGCPFSAVMVRRTLVDSGELTDPAGLRGRRVDLNIMHLEAFMMGRLLAGAGLTLDDIEIVDVPPPAEVDALSRGAIDVTVATEPDVTRLLRSGSASVLGSSGDLIPGHQLAYVLYGPSLLVDDRDAGRRFMVAFLRAVHDLTAGGERVLEIVARHTGLDRDLLEEACWPAFREDGRVELASVREFHDWALERGLLEAPAPLDELWEPAFVEHALGRLQAGP